MSREDFEKRMLDFGTVYSAVYTEEGREEDVSAAYNFAYSPWPHIYDGYANRDAYGMVSPPPPPIEMYMVWQTPLLKFFN